MLQLRRDFGQRLQDESVLQNLAARNIDRTVMTDKVVVQQQVEIERTWPESLAGSLPAVGLLDVVQLPYQMLNRQIGIKAGHQVIEIVALETDRRAVVNRGQPERAKPVVQRS